MSALQRGDCVLITGATGWVGSHIAHEALAAGLHVKLAVRNEAKAQQVVQALKTLHGSGRISTVVVEDFTRTTAYDEAMKDVQGVVHTASDVSFSSNPHDVIPHVLEAYNSLLEAADAHKSIRRLVLTSSKAAVGSHNTTSEQRQYLDITSWNDQAVQGCKTAPNGVNVYAASKTLSEKAAWNFVASRKPSFALTSINPSAVFGAPVPGMPIASTGAWLLDAAAGKSSPLQAMAPSFQVDVDDVAKLHVIALTREDVKNERIIAAATMFSYNALLDTIKKVHPGTPTVSRHAAWSSEDNTSANVSRANELLKGQGGLHTLEYSVRRNLKAT
ncbi:hypothetical protein CBS101457_005070 [Exobasidium rhododendri]|nr:hypothetical protein CBS101457_005070 [Exobasidium rhododendri]